MNIQEIRQQYPQYNDMSDQQLVDSLHQKYYSDMSKQDFSSKIGHVSASSPNSNTYSPLSQAGSFLSGATDATVKSAALLGGFLNEMGGRLGIISPSTQKYLSDQGNDIKQRLLTPTDSERQMRKDYPTTEKAGEIAGYMGTLASGTGIATSAAKLAGAGEIVAPYAANALVSSIGAGEGNRTMGAVLGAAGEGLTQGVSSLVGKSLNALTAKSSVQQLVNQANKNIPEGLTPGEVAAQSISNKWNAVSNKSDELFNAFRSTPGDISPATKNIATNAQNLLNEFGDQLTPQQKGVFQSAISQASNSTNLSQLHDLRKYLTQNFDVFSGNQANSDVYGAYQALNNNVNTSMNTASNALGVGYAYKQANNFYKKEVLPMINDGSADLSKILSDPTQSSQASKLIDNLIDKNIKNNKPLMAQNFMNNLDPVGKQAVETHILDKALDSTLSNGEITNLTNFNKTLTNLGKTNNIVFSPDTQNMIKGVSKLVDDADTFNSLLPKSGLMKTLSVGGIAGGMYLGGLGPLGITGTMAGVAGAKALLNSSVGQQILMKAGSSTSRGISKELLRSLIQSGTLSIIPSQSNETESSNPNRTTSPTIAGTRG